jgi:2-amino-4-hydroxy-6-hydroxymethyldihydropteridine diphosphokinase
MNQSHIYSPVYLGLGSNLNDPHSQSLKAISLIDESNQIQIEKISSFYQTKPLCLDEDPDQTPWYINSCIEISTSYKVEELFSFLQKIEEEMGRVKNKKWESRIIDIDILFFKNQIIKNDHLTIPHPEITNRSFVLIPLNEIAPDFIHPQFDKRISQIIKDKKFSKDEISKML